MSDETSRTSRRWFGAGTTVMVGMALLCLVLVSLMAGYHLGSGGLGQFQPHAYQARTAALLDLVYEVSVDLRETIPQETTVAYKQYQQHLTHVEQSRQLNPIMGAQRDVRPNDSYAFDPTYGMRRQSEIDRLRPCSMPTGDDYRHMRQKAKHQAKMSTIITDWDVFARDINRSVPTAEEFSAILRGDRSIWAVD